MELPIYMKCMHTFFFFFASKLADKDGKSQGSPSRRHGSKDVRPAGLTEPIESAYFGLSVNYGARDFYTSSLTMNTSETPSTVSHQCAVHLNAISLNQLSYILFFVFFFRIGKMEGVIREVQTLPQEVNGGKVWS